MAQYRVLRLITWLPTGGIERKIAAVLPRLDRSLFEVHLCCIRERGPLADDLERAGIPVHLIPFRSRLDPIGLRRLHRLVRRLNIDLVHSHMYRSNVPATLLKLYDENLAVVGHYHNVDTWEGRRQFYLDRYLSRRRDMNIAVSEAVRQDVITRLKLDEDRVRTLYNGVDLEEFHPLPAPDRQAMRARLGYEGGEKLVVSMARLVMAKNQELILRSIPEILATAPEARFLFVGSGPDEERLLRLAEELQVEEYVRFLGRRDDVPQILAACDVSVLPSLREGFSNTILESMACGLPVVASNVGGNGEVVDHGINGYLCDVAPSLEAVSKSGHKAQEVNSGQFVRYVRRLLEEDEVRARASRAALETIKHFSIDSMVHDVEQLYLELLEEQS